MELLNLAGNPAIQISGVGMVLLCFTALVMVVFVSSRKRA